MTALKNRRYRVCAESPAKKSPSAAMSAGPVGRIIAVAWQVGPMTAVAWRASRITAVGREAGP